MRKVIMATALAVLLLGAHGAHGVEGFKSPDTVGEFLTQCQGKASVGAIHCIGVIRGIASILQANIGSNSLYKMCITGFTSFGQMRQAFINWAKANPKDWQIEGDVGITVALMQTWPCKK